MSGDSQEVEIEYSAKDQAILRSLTAVEHEFEKLSDRMTDVEKKSRHASEAGEEGFGGMAKKAAEVAVEVTGIASAMSALDKIIEAVKKHFEDLEEQQKKAAESQLDYAGWLGKLADRVALPADEVDRRVRQVAVGAGATPQKAAAALGGAQAGGNAQTPAEMDQAAQTAKAVLSLDKGRDAPEIEQESSGVETFRKLVGSDADTALGLLKKIQQESGLGADAATTNSRIIKPMTEAVQDKFDAASAGALFATLNRTMNDPTGKTSDAAFVKLIEAIHAHFPGQNPSDVLKKLMAGDQATRFKLFHKEWGADELKLEGPEAAGLRGLIGDANGQGSDPAEIAMYQRLAKEFADRNAMKEVPKKIVENRGKDRILLNKEKEEGNKATTEQSKVFASDRDADINEAGNILEDQLATSGEGYFARWGDSLKFKWRLRGGNEDPWVVLRELLTRRVRQLEDPQEDPLRPGTSQNVRDKFNKLFPDGYRPDSPEYRQDLDRAEAIRRELDLLKEKHPESSGPALPPRPSPSAPVPAGAAPAPGGQASPPQPPHAADQRQASAPPRPHTPGDDGTSHFRETNRLLAELVAQGSRPCDVRLVGRPEQETSPASSAYSRFG